MRNKIKTAITVLILVAMSGIAVAEGDQIYGMMGDVCPDCTDVSGWQGAEVSVASASITTAAAPTVEEWAYGRRNVCPDGIEHVCWDFEEGSNLYPLKNAHPDVAVFENVSNSRCCYPACSDINEPSYVRKGSNCGPRCRCVMHIYPYATTFPNGTEMPYISALTGNAAFSPRVELGGLRCYWPACSAFIGFKEGTKFVSFLASTHGTLAVRLYDHRGGYLGGSNIYVNTRREGDAPPNFTRFSIHLPAQEIGFMTLRGPFNGWNIDDLIVGGEFGYLGLRRDYSYAAERLKQLIGVPHHEFAIGFNLEMHDYLSVDEITDDKPDPYWDKRNRELIFVNGISDDGAIAWAFNGCEGCEELVNWADVTDQFNKDFTEEVAIEDLQPGDVFFIDYPAADGFPDGQIDEVGMYVVDTEFGGYTYDAIRITYVPDGSGKVSYDTVEMIELIYGEKGFVDYRCLPDSPKGGHSPYPKIPTKMWI